jgi:predicted nucleic acid-binding Zn ribbon protein
MACQGSSLCDERNREGEVVAGPMKKVGDLLREYLRDRGWLSGSPYDPLFSGWAKISGEAIAAHATLTDVRAGYLIVDVDHPGWIQMVRLRQASILEAARKAAPGVSLEGIRVRLGEPRQPGR